MGYKQTSEHRYGKGSYHQVGLVRGQFGNVAMDKWVPFLKDTGFDGWEEASWELDLDKCKDDASAEAYAKERGCEPDRQSSAGALLGRVRQSPEHVAYPCRRSRSSVLSISLPKLHRAAPLMWTPLTLTRRGGHVIKICALS